MSWMVSTPQSLLITNNKYPTSVWWRRVTRMLTKFMSRRKDIRHNNCTTNCMRNNKKSWGTTMMFECAYTLTKNTNKRTHIPGLSPWTRVVVFVRTILLCEHINMITWTRITVSTWTHTTVRSNMVTYYWIHITVSTWAQHEHIHYPRSPTDDRNSVSSLLTQGVRDS